MTVHWLVPSTKRLNIKVVVMLAGAGIVDWYTPAEFEVFSLYLASVMFASWMGGTGYGFVTTVVAGLMIFTQGWLQGHPYSSQFFFMVAIANKIGILVCLSFFIALARKDHIAAIEGASKDHLTKIANRRTLLERLALELHRSARKRTSFVFAYLDLDGFKKVNDERGHEVGDQVLIMTAKTILSHLRPADLGARVGGDEFCILIADASPDEGRSAIIRMHEGLRQAMQTAGWPITFSVGMVTSKCAADDVADIIRQADNLMLEAKRAGKDRIVEK